MDRIKELLKEILKQVGPGLAALNPPQGEALWPLGLGEGASSPLEPEPFCSGAQTARDREMASQPSTKNKWL